MIVKVTGAEESMKLGHCVHGHCVQCLDQSEEENCFAEN